MRSLLMISVGFSALVAAVPGAGVAWADEAAPVDLNQPVRVAPVTVVGTRSERRVDEVPASISVITAKDIETNLVTDIKDLIRFEPGVSVRDFDVSLLLVFDDKAAEAKYLKDPRHVKFVDENKALFEKVRVFDTYLTKKP